MPDRFVVGFDTEEGMYLTIDLRTNQYLIYSPDSDATHRFTAKFNDPLNMHYTYEEYAGIWTALP